MTDDPRIGTQVGPYKIERLIGRGGMGVVYLAEHATLGRKAAVKVLSPELAEDTDFRERFLRESRMAGNLDQENIIGVYDAGEVNGLLYIAMRYVEGSDLAGLLRSRGALSPSETLGILSQVGMALDAAHEQGLVHRDVKPANILLSSRQRDGVPLVYLTDFGLTKKSDSRSRLTRTGYFLGTLDYAAPEQFQDAELDARTDVYALGCVLYECLTGEVPYARSTDAALMYAHCMEPPPKPTLRRSDLPPAVDQVLERAMAKSKEERFDSCGEMIHAFERSLKRPRDTVSVAPLLAPPLPPAPIPPATPTAPTEVPPTAAAAADDGAATTADEEPAKQEEPARRGRGMWIAAALLVLLAAAGTAFALLRPTSSTTSSGDDAGPSGSSASLPEAVGEVTLGGRAAFVSEVGGDSDIFVMRGDGSKPQNLTDDPAEDVDPSWNPDAETLAFTSDRGGNEDIFELDTATGTVTPLVEDPATDVSPVWAPDGTQLAFASDRGGSLDIWVLDTELGSFTQMTDQGSAETQPAWSPDGERLAFVSERRGQTDLFVMNVEGGRARRITDDEAREGAPAWAPDGELLALERSDDGGSDIYTVGLDGSDLQVVTGFEGDEREPAWSPDGDVLAFESDFSGDFEIYAVNADGSELTQLTTNDSEDLQVSIVAPLATATPTVAPTGVIPTTDAPEETAEPPAVAGAPTPESAATNLFNAWQAGDQGAALTTATSGAVSELFAVSPGNFEFQGCVEDTPGRFFCGYFIEGSALSMVASNPGNGFVVEDVIFTAD